MRQWLVVRLIVVLECIVNSSRLIILLNRLSDVLRLRGGRYLDRLLRCRWFEGLRVAFIADGNRRFARKRGTAGGSSADRGFAKIVEFIQFAHYNKFREVSFYCFSIKNFQRKDTEVGEIMDFIKKSRPMNVGVPVSFRIYGNLALLEDSVREALVSLEEETRSAGGLVVNIFFAYSSSAEERGYGEPSHNERVFGGGVDLIVRTSNTRRLSDFMVRHAASSTAIDFVAPLWPEYSVLHLYLTLAKYCLEQAYLND